jgi:hypothetical protein
MLDSCVFFDVFIRSGESLFFWSCFDRRWSGPGCRLGSLHAFFFTIQFCSCAARSRSSRSPLLCVAVFFGFHCRPRLPLPIFYFVRRACNWCAPQLVSCASVWIHRHRPDSLFNPMTGFCLQFFFFLQARGCGQVSCFSSLFRFAFHILRCAPASVFVDFLSALQALLVGQGTIFIDMRVVGLGFTVSISQV